MKPLIVTGIALIWIIIGSNDTSSGKARVTPAKEETFVPCYGLQCSTPDVALWTWSNLFTRSGH